MSTDSHFIKPDEVKNFITLQGEELILAQRKHWLIVLQPILNIICASMLLMFALYILMIVYLAQPLLWITGTTLILTFGISSVIKVIIAWYCHLYIVTDRRIMEICHVPFSSYHVNDLLIDQMRVVEIDIDVGTIYNELIGKGDVRIRLDQYAHEHTFILHDVAQPRKTATYLTQTFGNNRQDNIWATPLRFKPKFIS